MIEQLDQAKRLIEAGRRILITSHVRPDGDAVGSIAALKQAIERAAGENGPAKQVQLLLLSNLGENYRFLLPEETWIVRHTLPEEDLTPSLLDEFDLLIICDTSAYRQLDGIADYLQQRQTNSVTATTADGGILVIDHHLSSDGVGHSRLIDTTASAAGELVYRLIRHAGWPLSKTAADALFTAIATDTGWFRFENTNKAALEIAAELVAAGVRPDELYQRLYQNDPPERLELVKLTLETLELHAEGRVAVMHISKAMLEAVRAHRTLIENIVNIPMDIGTVEAVALLVEVDEGTRCSLRSKKLLDVNEIARGFGGGGHARAAGLTVEESWIAFKPRIVAAIGEALSQA